MVRTIASHLETTMNVRVRTNRRRHLALAGATVVILALTACSSGGTAASSDTPTGAPIQTLKVGVGSSAVDYGAFWVAEAKGIFTKNGLDIQPIYNTSSGSANLIASGQEDIQLYTMPLGLQVAAQGKPISMIYALSQFDSTSFAIAGSKSITEISQLKSKGSACRIGNTGHGSGTYAYQSSFLKGYELDCQSVSLADVPSVVAAVAAGSVDAASIPYNVALAAAAQGKLNILVNPANMTESEASKVVPTPYPAYAAFGLTSVLKKKPDAVARFIKSFNQASAILAKSSPDQLADDLLSLAPFKGTVKSSLVASWATSKGRFPVGANAGFLSKADYEHSLKSFELWGLPEYDPKNSALAYSTLVDMSYWEAATK